MRYQIGVKFKYRIEIENLGFEELGNCGIRDGVKYSRENWVLVGEIYRENGILGGENSRELAEKDCSYYKKNKKLDLAKTTSFWAKSL